MSTSASTENISTCVKCGNGPAQIDNICLKCDEKLFISTLKALLTEEGLPAKVEKIKRVHIVFTILNEKPYWKNYRNLKTVIIRKAYQFIGEIKVLQIPSSEREVLISTMTRTLESCLCNKWLTREKRYCNKKKIGKYCTYHSTLKSRLDNNVKSSVYPYLNTDVISVILSLID
jgi:hypothetical protein